MMKKSNPPSDERLNHLLDQLREVEARDAQGAAAGRQKYLDQVAAIRSSQAVRGIPAGRKARGRVFPLFRNKNGFPLVNTLVAVILACVLIFGGSSVTVFAAQESLPGEALYGVKILSEDVLLSLAPSSKTKLELTLDYSDRRIEEISSLQSAGHPIPEQVVERFQKELDQTLTLAAGLNDPTMASSLDQASRRAQDQLQKMSSLVDANPNAANLLQINTRLHQQLQDVQFGRNDPQGFRQKVRQQFFATPEPSTTGSFETINPEATATDQNPDDGGGSWENTPAGGTPDHPHKPPTKTKKTPGGHDRGPGRPNETPAPGGGSGGFPGH